jgi:hypothetical protein
MNYIYTDTPRVCLVFLIVTSCWVEISGISCIYWYTVEGFGCEEAMKWL